MIRAKSALLSDGWAQDVVVTLQDGRIASVETGLPGPEAADLLLPAPCNLHSHVFQRAMAGMTEYRTGGQDSFWTWRDLMYRFVTRITPDDLASLAAMVMVESAESGFGSICEFHYLHHGPDGQAYDDIAEMSGRVVEAAKETGLGLTLLPVLYERGGCDGRALNVGQGRFGNDPDRFAALWQRAGRHLAALPADAVLGVAPHSLRAASPQGIAQAAGLGAGPVHIHVAEQMAEVEEVRAAYGARPVARVLDHHGADARWCLIHATQMEPGETAALAASGAVAGLCPVTEANLGDGIFDGARYRQAGGLFGVGSDSNVRVDLIEELRLYEYSQRLGQKARAVLADERSVGRLLWDDAARGGARAAGRGQGVITPGAWADLVAMRMDGPDGAGAVEDRALDALIFARGGRVDRLWSAGREIVRGGRHVARAAVEGRYAKVLKRLREAI